MNNNNTVRDLVDFVVLQLLDVPSERRTEAMVHVLAQYRVDLERGFPGTDDALRTKFLTVFFALLQQRMGEVAMSGDTGGTA